MRKRNFGGWASLKKPRVRQSWSKTNLWRLKHLNLDDLVENRGFGMTYYQQKWAAKALTRAYHGEQVRTQQWQRQFSRALPSVIPMDHRVLARSDGSDQSSGRGRGVDTQADAHGISDRKMRPKQIRQTPYMQMAYHPLERRLDTAIFRALFASSILQARSMVLQGHVTVNGKKMMHPSYALNPGDMFSVDPKVVMLATGAPRFHIGNENQVKKLKEKAEKELKELQSSSSRASEQAAEAAESAAAEEDADAEEATASDEGLTDPERAAKKTLRDMRKEILSMLEDKKDLSNKQKRLLRDLRSDIPKMMSKKQFAKEDISNAQQRLAEAYSSTLAADVSEAPQAPAEEETPSAPSAGETYTATSSLRRLRLQIRYMVENWRELGIPSGPRRVLRLQYVKTQLMLLDPQLLQPKYIDAITEKVAKIADEYDVKLGLITRDAFETYRTDDWNLSDPYQTKVPLMDGEEPLVEAEAPETPDAPFQGGIAETAMLRLTEPWRPRDYMSAFAFIPRYLEVNQNVCSAVYLRHPVARPGLAEVPTPFPESVSQLAFNWFLRRS